MLGGKVEVPTLNGKTEVKVTTLGGTVHAYTVTLLYYVICLLFCFVCQCIYRQSIRAYFKFKMLGNNLILFLTGNAHVNLCFVEAYMLVLVEWIGFPVLNNMFIAPPIFLT